MPPRSAGRSSRPAVPARPASADLELAESGASFLEEASDHALAQSEFRGFKPGPVDMVPGSAVSPGVLGWRRTVARANGASSDLYYLVGGFAVKRTGPSPLREFGWSEFLPATPTLRPVAGAVLLRPAAAHRAPLAGLAARVAEALGQLDE